MKYITITKYIKLIFNIPNIQAFRDVCTMTIYTFKDMIESLLKRNKTAVFIGFCILILLLSCRNDLSKTKMPVKNVGIKQTENISMDTIYFIKGDDGVFNVVNKSDAHFFRVIIEDSSSYGYRFFDYSTYQFAPDVYEPVQTGRIKNLYELTPHKAIANGKWIVFGNDTHPSNLKYHKIGYYKEGVKDSIWYTNYEDGWDAYFYYKNGVSIDYEGRVKFYGYKGALVAEGSGFLTSGLPIGVWKYYNNYNEILEHEYIHQKDSIIVRYTKFDRKTKSILDKGAYIGAKYTDELELREYKN